MHTLGCSKYFGNYFSFTLNLKKSTSILHSQGNHQKKIQNMEKIFADQTSNKYIESKNPRFTRNPYNSKRANK